MCGWCRVADVSAARAPRKTDACELRAALPHLLGRRLLRKLWGLQLRIPVSASMWKRWYSWMDVTTSATTNSITMSTGSSSELRR